MLVRENPSGEAFASVAMSPSPLGAGLAAPHRTPAPSSAPTDELSGRPVLVTGVSETPGLVNAIPRARSRGTLTPTFERDGRKLPPASVSRKSIDTLRPCDADVAIGASASIRRGPPGVESSALWSVGYLTIRSP